MGRVQHEAPRAEGVEGCAEATTRPQPGTQANRKYSSAVFSSRAGAPQRVLPIGIKY
jgi:hypothetical protein